MANTAVLKEFDNCVLCPRECRANRNAGQLGYCGCDASYNIASVCIHKGEEPPVNGKNGICNLFFTGCNLRCSFCQNYQISRRKSANQKEQNLQDIMQEIISCLDSGIEAIGFVSPTHHVPHVKEIIRELHRRNYHPVTVYNTNAYDKVSVLKDLEGLIDVYLPDFKYLDSEVAKSFSDATGYPEIAKEAIKEMYRQKGSSVILNENGQAITGMIVRHLVLPGQSDDSVKIMQWIAEELSSSVHVSLMSQYYPTACVGGHPVLGRKITEEEYTRVLNAMEEFGFYRGWIQEYESSVTYRPDFDRSNPFEV